MRHVWRIWGFSLLFVFALAACDSASSNEGPDVTAEPDVVAGPDIVSVPDVAPVVDVVADVAPGPDIVTTDVPEDVLVGLPQSLPFEFTRPQVGEPLTDEEVTEFTRTITGFWKDYGYFQWLRMFAHGMHPGNEEGYPDYALYHQDYRVVKEGDTVTFRHTGRADNLTLRTCKVLNNVLAGYLMFGDEDMRWIAEQYSKGLAALAMAMEFGDDDPVKYLQARAVFTQDHSYDTLDGRHVVIDYDPMRKEDESWNAANIHNPNNPYWGDIWFVNQRSKDDVPHMFRTVPMLMRAAEEAPDASVREAAALALEYMQGFAADIVASEYQIRTKFEDGEAVVPTKEGGAVKDLASLTLYDWIFPYGECNAQLGAALVSSGEPLGEDCLSGLSRDFEDIATDGHYFNYAIYRFFHIAAVANLLMTGQNEQALASLQGLAERADQIMYDETMPNRDEADWWADAGAFLLASASSAGLPLTNAEARVVVQSYTDSATHWAGYPLWDPWDESVEDGDYNYKYTRGGVAVRPTELGYLLEYCYSPFVNEAGARFVDCDVIRDPSRWGE